MDSKIILALVFLQVTFTFGQETNLTFILSAKNLPAEGHDDYSKLDPIVKVYQTTPGTTELELVGKSEPILNDQNPEWVQVFWVTHKSGTAQKLRFELKDTDLLNQDDAVGGGEIDLDDFVTKGQKVTIPINGVEGATLTMEKTTPIKFKLAAKNLPKKDKPPTIFAAFTSDEGESDPYVKCYFRRGIGGADKKYATTSTIDNVVDATWNDVIEFGNYQPGTNQYWRFKVKDSDSTSKDDDVGEVILEIDPFVKANVPKDLKLQSENGDIGAILTITPL